MKQVLATVILLGSTSVFAAEIVKFRDGDVVYADQINGNFQVLKSRLDELQDEISNLRADVQRYHPPYSVPIERVYQFSGNIEQLEIPEGTYAAVFELFGAQGGDAEYGGLGGFVKAAISLDSSAEAYVVIGGAGFGNDELNGFNGGASEGGLAGGGATDVRIGGRTLEDRILVAGGGGQRALLGGTGFFAGGNGGGANGENGPSVEGSTGGEGGSQFGGGAGGLGNIQNGGQGKLGLGGVGDDDNGHGGGGYFGGGGGGSSGGLRRGGGGGGSSFVTDTARDVVFSQGVNLGNGKAGITFMLIDSDGDGAPDLCGPLCVAAGLIVDANSIDPSVK